MRFSILYTLGAVASIAQYAGANPMRVVVVTGGQQLSNIRVGFPAVNNINLPPLEIPNPESFPPTEINEAGPPPPLGAVRRPCHSMMPSTGRVEHVSDVIRQIFGFTSPPPSDEGSEGFVHILPYLGPDGVPTHPSEVPEHRHRHHHHSHHNRPFFNRIHHALMTLGPWEGRAVAFVLGCGIGVLLRMFWVLTVIAYRLFRGEREEDVQYIAVVCDHYDDGEEAVVPPPPQYIIDEKVALGVEPKKQIDEA
jgi:hypothetical protein